MNTGFVPGWGRRRVALRWWLRLLALAGLVGWCHAAGPVRHRLIEGSEFIDDCPPCGRPTIPMRLRGTFDLELLEENPLFARYALRNIEWATADWGGGVVKIRGAGELEIGGEVAVVQRWRLDVQVSIGGTNIHRHFTNDAPGVIRGLPNVAADLTAEEKLFTQVFHLAVRSAPLRELWFVTAHGFTPGIVGQPIGPYRPAGDVLSMDGSIPFENRDLTSGLGLMPVVPPLAVDALEMLPGGVALFSLRESVFSESLGDLPSGTLLTSQGRVYRRLGALLEPFGPVPIPLPDSGLDGVQVLDDGEVLFSLAADHPAAGGLLLHGDILSSSGVVRHRFKDLVAAFEPSPAPGSDMSEVGLDAFHEWPHGEVWFSVVRGFQSARVGAVWPGDVVSSLGWVVYRNLEMLEPFGPLEDLADFGLAGLYVVTDLAAPEKPLVMGLPRVGKSVDLEWKGEGRVFQVESAEILGAPFRPLGPIQARSRWTSPAWGAEGWYRVRSW